jgi:hypothetical protein
MPTPHNRKQSPRTAPLLKSEIPSRHQVLRVQEEATRKTPKWLPRSHNGNLHIPVKTLRRHHQATQVLFVDTLTQVKVQELQHQRMLLRWEEEESMVQA